MIFFFFQGSVKDKYQYIGDVGSSDLLRERQFSMGGVPRKKRFDVKKSLSQEVLSLNKPAENVVLSGFSIEERNYTEKKSTGSCWTFDKNFIGKDKASITIYFGDRERRDYSIYTYWKKI